MNHSFNIELAFEYGVEQAILIHHFQHWIAINKRLNKNFHENRTWTYTTQNELLAIFPYFKNRYRIMRLIDELVEKKILIKGNFNKLNLDKTIWYAFNEEQKFVNLKHKLDVLEAYENQDEHRLCKNEHSKCETAHPLCKNAQPIPDTNNTNTIKKDVYKYTSKKEEKTEPKAPSPLATELLAEFEKSLKENLPEIKGKRPTQGACYLDQLLKNYSVEEIKAVIKFSHTDEFWKLHVHTPSYLKAKFSQLLVALRRPPKPKISFDKPKIDRTQSWWDDYAPTCNPEQCATDEEKIALGLIPSHLKEKYKAQGGKV